MNNPKTLKLQNIAETNSSNFNLLNQSVSTGQQSLINQSTANYKLSQLKQGSSIGLGSGASRNKNQGVKNNLFNNYLTNQQQIQASQSVSRNFEGGSVNLRGALTNQNKAANKQFVFNGNLNTSSTSNHQSKNSHNLNASFYKGDAINGGMQNIPINIGKTMPSTQRDSNLKNAKQNQIIFRIQQQRQMAGRQEIEKEVNKSLALEDRYKDKSQSRNLKNSYYQNSILSAIHTSGNQSTTAQSKSFNFDIINSTRLTQALDLPFNMIEHLQKNGCSAVYACGPLNRNRYINPKLEKELIDFKQEVEGKFMKSPLNTFAFPRILQLEQDESQSEITSTTQDQTQNDLSSYLAEAEVKVNLFKKAPKTVRKFMDHNTTLINYKNQQSINSGLQQDQQSKLECKPPSKIESLNQISLNYENNVYESNSVAGSSIPTLKNTQKYDQRLDDILRKTNAIGSTNRNQPIKNGLLSLKKNDSTLKEPLPNESTTRFRDSSHQLRMPELNQPVNQRYQNFDNNQTTLKAGSHSHERHLKKKSNRMLQNVQVNSLPQQITNYNSSSSGIANSIINVNNPQVIIQSPQNNTIILVDSKLQDQSSRNIINQLEKNGYITNKYQNERSVGASQVNKRYFSHYLKALYSFNYEGSTVNSYRNLQQSRMFESYVKQKINLGPAFQSNHGAVSASSRNKINISTTHKAKAQYETNRSTTINKGESKLQGTKQNPFNIFSSQNQYSSNINQGLAAAISLNGIDKEANQSIMVFSSLQNAKLKKY